MAEEVKEQHDHDVCWSCGAASIPAEGVPDQALRGCPECFEEWTEDLSSEPHTQAGWRDEEGNLSGRCRACGGTETNHRIINCDGQIAVQE